MADGGKGETKDRDLKWPESRKLWSLISAPDLRRCADTHLRHRVGPPWGGTVFAERDQACVLPASSLEQGSLCPGQLPPLRHRGLSWDLLGEALRKQSFSFREKRPSAVSQFLWPPESQRQLNPPSSGDTPRGVGWPQGRTAGEPGAQAWGLVLAERQGSWGWPRVTWNSSGDSQEAGTQCVFTLNHLSVERCPGRRRLGGLGVQAGRDSRRPWGWAEAAWPHPQGEVVEITQWCWKQVISSMKSH